MFSELHIELADILVHGIAVVLVIIMRVACCNDRTRRPIPGAS